MGIFEKSKLNIQKPEVVPDQLPFMESLLWYPKAQINKVPKGRATGAMRTRGKYKHGYPLGAIVHYTAGRADPMGPIDSAIKNGYAYFVIDKDGLVYQNFPLNEWGYHAGRSMWKGLTDTVSDELVGIEICCAGKLEINDGELRTWYGDRVPPGDVRQSTGVDNQAKGFYMKYTLAQEEALRDLLVWLKENGKGIFSYDLVLGHDEVSPGRKVDPGASLSMTMPQYREFLKSL